MTREDQDEIRRLQLELRMARREHERLVKRREELECRQVRDEARRQRFLLRLNNDIAEAKEKLDAAEIALEGYGHGR